MESLFKSQYELIMFLCRAKITMSADKTMFVCYHPAKPFPLQFSKVFCYLNYICNFKNVTEIAIIAVIMNA